MAETEKELMDRISKLHNLINTHKKQQPPIQTIQPIQQQAVKPIFNKLPPNHVKLQLQQQQAQQYRPKQITNTYNNNKQQTYIPPIQNKPIIQNKPFINNVNNVNNVNNNNNNIQQTSPVIFGGYKPKALQHQQQTQQRPTIVNRNMAKPISSPPIITKPIIKSAPQTSPVIFGGYKAPTLPIVNKTTIRLPIVSTNSQQKSNVIFSGYKAPTFKPTSTVSRFSKSPFTQAAFKNKLLLNNRLMVIKKLKQQKLISSSRAVIVQQSPKVIDSIFVKDGNSLVRKELNEKYIMIGNKLIRAGSSNNTPIISSPKTTTTTTSPTVKKSISFKPISTTNRNMKISDRIKEAVKRKSIGYNSKNSSSTSSKKKVRYCLFFNRFGKCNDGDKCRYQHDVKRIRVCPKFVAGNCDDPECKLQHSITDLEQMPICHLFLSRRCTNDKCPYLHVNLSKDTKICPDFSNGYCQFGSKCELKHTYVQHKEKSKKDQDTSSTVNDNNSSSNNNNNNNNNINNSFQDSFFDDFEFNNVSNENNDEEEKDNNTKNDDNIMIDKNRHDIYSFMPKNK